MDQVFCKDRGDGLDALLRQSDAVALALALALPLSDATHHMIGEREFTLMPGARSWSTWDVATPDRIGRSLDSIGENLRRYRAGEPMLNVLTGEDVYTKG